MFVFKETLCVPATVVFADFSSDRSRVRLNFLVPAVLITMLQLLITSFSDLHKRDLSQPHNWTSHSGSCYVNYLRPPAAQRPHNPAGSQCTGQILCECSLSENTRGRKAACVTSGMMKVPYDAEITLSRNACSTFQKNVG